MSSIAQDGTQGAAARIQATQDLDADSWRPMYPKPRKSRASSQHALDRYGRIDALVNNAAIGPLGNVLQTTEEVWDRIIAVNLKGVICAARR